MDYNATALVYLNSPEVLDTVTSALESQQVKVLMAKDATSGLDLSKSEKYDFAVIDQSCLDIPAVEFVKKARGSKNNINPSNLVPFFIIGPDAKAYYREFRTTDSCKFIQLPINSETFTTTYLNFLGHFESPMPEQKRHLTKGEFLIEEGSESNEMYWLISGKLNITKRNQKGENIIIGEANPGELVGEMSFLETLPRSASVKAMEESDVIIIPHERFVNIFDGQPIWFKSLMRVLSKRLRNANQVIAQNYQHQDSEIELGQEDIDKLIQGLTEGF